MASITPQVVAERIERFGKCYTIDDVVRLRGRDAEQTPILGLPRRRDDPADYEYFTGADLDRMVDEACRVLVAEGLVVNSGKTIALYAVSDLSFVVTFFALFRLGCKVLALSARLGPPACLHLLATTAADVIVHGQSARIDATLAAVARARPGVRLLAIPARAAFDRPDATGLQPPPAPFVRPVADREAEHVQVALMAHSSGSTGLPKPLLLSPRSVMSSLTSGTGLRAFNALPWYHVHGLLTSLQAMWMRQPAHLVNPHLPLTAAHLVAALRAARPEICHTVPYVLGLIAEDPAGVAALQACRHVTSAGAKTPDELGDRLVRAGVRLGVIYGLTEVGHVGDSIGPPPGQEDAWAYVRPYAHLAAHMQFQHVEGDTYESVFLASHPALLPSSADAAADPPGSFHCRDLFTPHPTLPNAWKYVARQDDRLTLATGEKILPLAMEGRVRAHPLVRDALMFGSDRPVPGMLLFRAQAAAGLSEDAFVAAVWPAVEQANALADEFARLTRQTVASVAYGVDYPVTDKSNIIRAAALALFAEQIDALYARLDGHTASGNGNSADAARLDVPALEALVLDTFATHMGIRLPSAQADFFAAGVDSLRAIQARRVFQERLGLDRARALPTNVVYDARTPAQLAAYFHGLLGGGAAAAANGHGSHNGHNGHSGRPSTAPDEDPLAVMEGLVAQFSAFDPEPLRPAAAGGEHVLLTGATGALGAHLLHQLLHDGAVARVTCLVRGPHGWARVHESLRARGLDVGSGPALRSAARKLAVLETASLGDAHLGLDALAYAGLAADTTLVVHAAWPVHFGLAVSSFAPHLAGLRNLLQLSLQVPARRPARVVFASSISAAFNVGAGSGKLATVPEAPLASLRDSADLGYARSKLVGERICEAAARQGAARVAVLRIGQIAGDTDRGIWNDREAVPRLVRSALELRALPLLPGAAGRCEWTPVDVVAAACLEIAKALDGPPDGQPAGSDGDGARYYNITTPHALSWNEDLLPAWRAAGLDAEAVPLAAWLDRLRARGDALGPEAAAQRLPALELADYYETHWGAAPPSVRFRTDKACRDSPALASCPSVAEAQLAAKYLQAWLQKWKV